MENPKQKKKGTKLVWPNSARLQLWPELAAPATLLVSIVNSSPVFKNSAACGSSEA